MTAFDASGNTVAQTRLRATVVIAALVVCIAMGVVSSCSVGDDVKGHPRTGQRSQVIAITGIWADIISSVSCGRIPVESLIPAGADTHDFEVSIQSANDLLGAEVVFANGLGLDTALLPTLERARESGVDVVDLGAHLLGDLKPIEGDPHVWMDPGRVRALVPMIASQLSDLDLMDEADLTQCAESYTASLEALVKEMESVLDPVPVKMRQLVSEHHNLGYFAERFDFSVLGAMNAAPGSLSETDPRHLDELADSMLSAGITTVFVESGEGHHGAETFVKDLGVRGVVVPLYIENPPRRSADDAPAGPEDAEYVSMMLTNAQRIARALQK